MKATFRESRSSLATMTGHLPAFPVASAATSCGRRSEVLDLGVESHAHGRLVDDLGGVYAHHRDPAPCLHRQAGPIRSRHRGSASCATRYQSGNIDVPGRISRRGDKLLRSYLYEAACHLLTRSRSDSALKQWGVNLRARVGFKRAVVAIARKLAIILHAMWSKNLPFDPGMSTADAA